MFVDERFAHIYQVWPGKLWAPRSITKEDAFPHLAWDEDWILPEWNFPKRGEGGTSDPFLNIECPEMSILGVPMGEIRRASAVVAIWLKREGGCA